MSTPDPAQPAEPEATHDPAVVEARTEVELQRSVRYGRILIAGAVLGVVVAVIVSLMFPTGPDSEYTMGQVVGFMSLIGGVFGLALGAMLALLLGLFAKRRTGGGVAVHTDVS